MSLKEVNKKIEDTVVSGYKAIENGVVSGYKKVEDGAVGGYKKIEDKFVDKFLLNKIKIRKLFAIKDTFKL